MALVHIYQEFNCYSKALDFKDRTLCVYDPLAYDTWLRVYRRDGKYIVEGHRFASAD